MEEQDDRSEAISLGALMLWGVVFYMAMGMLVVRLFGW